jgi:hypothetical protein
MKSRQTKVLGLTIILSGLFLPFQNCTKVAFVPTEGNISGKLDKNGDKDIYIIPTDSEDINTQPIVEEKIERVYSYTGHLMNVIVPRGVSKMLVKAWGAGGGSEYQHGVYPQGGSGGFSSAEITVQSGQRLIIVVGEGGKSSLIVSDNNTDKENFGGGGRDSEDGGGGGLTGIFLNEISAENALIIAGGGGGASQHVGSYGVDGGSGNSTSSGGSHFLYGESDLSSNMLGSGGGGYFGGSIRKSSDPVLTRYAEGGSGYVVSNALSDIKLFSKKGSSEVPNSSDADYTETVKLNSTTQRARIGEGAGLKYKSNPVHGGHGLLVLDFK